jgi:hypothetical protein
MLEYIAMKISPQIQLTIFIFEIKPFSYIYPESTLTYMLHVKINVQI